MARKFLGIIFLLGFCIFLSGCPIIGYPFAFMTHKEYTTVPAEYDLQSLNAAIVVVPFKEKDGLYFDSEKGRYLARLVELQVRANLKNIRLISSNKILESETPLQLETADWESIGKKLAADYVLLGKITSFTTKDPRSVNVLLGRSGVEVELLSVSEGAACVWTKRISSQFPEDMGELAGVPTFQMNEEAIHDGLLLAAARDVVANFYKRKVKRFQVGREKIYQ